VYAGIRLGNDGKRRTAWVSDDGRVHQYSTKRAAKFVIGGVHEVIVDDELTMYGTPKYLHKADDDKSAEYWAAQRAAEMAYDLERRKQSDRKDDDFEAAIDHLAELISSVNYPQRPGLMNYVIYRLNQKAWK